jgi:hypothetical protein
MTAHTMISSITVSPDLPRSRHHPMYLIALFS